MRTKLRCGLILLLAIGASAGAWRVAIACADLASLLPKLEPLVLEDGEPNPAAVAALRAQGPEAVERLLASEPAADPSAQAARERALDAVCAQRDCAASGLFWHTDLETAQREARRTRRPILSLRLLGRLDEEFSCANSRFFRTALYADPRISGRLRERFVLHWESVRPAPRVTVDFGDGRRLEGTITGNSIHYVLDARGRLVDAIPGLYGPGAFLGALTRAEDAARELAPLEGDAWTAAFAAYHEERLAALDGALAGAGGFAAVRLPARASSDPPGAREAAEMAVTKSTVELPILGALVRTAELTAAVEDGGVDWQALAEHHRAAAALGPESRALLLRKHRPASEGEGERAIEAFERLVALDTVRNEYLLHGTLHEWLGSWARFGDVPGLAQVNDLVYARLFLTPRSDPWLGLVSPETYLALEPAG